MWKRKPGLRTNSNGSMETKRLHDGTDYENSLALEHEDECLGIQHRIASR
jgi:hypothetical protein